MSVSADSVKVPEHHHAHHFKDGEHEFDTSKFGFWIFLLQEVLFFSPLFVGFIVFKFMHFEDFKIASAELKWFVGGVNTIFLIFSSFTIARAISAAQRNHQRAIFENLVLTMLCAFGFLLVKTYEYSDKIGHGILPGKWFSNEAMLEAAPQAPLFYTFYYVMTGLHALHVIGGMVYLGYLIYRSKKGVYGPNNYLGVENFGLYWHFVDLVWIFLFPLLYLVK